MGQIDASHRSFAEASARDEKGYREALERLLTRYSYPSGKTAFDEVDDLNDWDGYTGVYVLAFDGEKRYYVGMADKSFKKRILEHFRKPQTDFDRTHSFEDLSSIHVLCGEYTLPISMTEADCIATLGPEYVCNSRACSPFLVETYIRLGAPSELLLRGVHDDDYPADIYLMSDKDVQSTVECVEGAKEAVRMDAELAEREAAARKIRWCSKKYKTYDLCLSAVRHDGVSLLYVPDEMRDATLCEAAVKRSGKALLSVPKRLRTPELCLLAIESISDPADAYHYIPKEYVTEEYALELVAQNRRVTKCLPKELKTDRVMQAAGYRRQKKN